MIPEIIEKITRIWGYILIAQNAFYFVLGFLPKRSFEIPNNTYAARARYWIESSSLWKPRITYINHNDRFRKLDTQNLILFYKKRPYYARISYIELDGMNSVETISIITFKHEWLDDFSHIFREKSPEELEHSTCNNIFRTSNSKSAVEVLHSNYNKDNLLTGINKDSFEAVDKLIDGFIRGKDICFKNNATWSIGVILTGPPGTGKSHMLQMYAAHKSIEAYFCLSLTNIHSIDATLGITPKGETEPFIIVLEDIDRILSSPPNNTGGTNKDSYKAYASIEDFLNDGDDVLSPPTPDDYDDDYDDYDDADSYDEDDDDDHGSYATLDKTSHSTKDKKEGEFIQELINIVDGANTPYGAIFVFTCNDPSKIPDALVNRCKVIEMPKIEPYQVEEIVKAWGIQDVEKFSRIENLRELKRKLFEEVSGY